LVERLVPCFVYICTLKSVGMPTEKDKRNGLLSEDVVVMNFSGAYDMENLPRNGRLKWIDCRHLSGTDCYCDNEGEEALAEIIGRCPVGGIHFIDSGNYHYVTKFWTDRIHEPFALVMLDHHPDMQPPLFEHILSCGSWVKDVLDSNPNCRKVVIVGASDELIRSVPHGYEGMVHFYSDNDLDHEESWKRFSQELISEPVYISIDKDVLSPEYAVTNWDQGSMSLKELEKLLYIILLHHPVLGMDICGEFLPDSDTAEDMREAAIDGNVNKYLLRLVKAINRDVPER